MNQTIWIVTLSILPAVMAGVPICYATPRWRWATILWLFVCAVVGGMAISARLAVQHYVQLRSVYSSEMPGGFLHEYGEFTEDANAMAIFVTSLLLWLNLAGLIGLGWERWLGRRGPRPSATGGE